MNEVHAHGSAVPLTVLTGFLGAGKTTLLNRILNGDHGLRVAVLVNDFGALNVDADLVTGITGDVMSLANGCVCCQIRDDLVEAVDTVLGRPEGVEYILLEASGVADPSGLFMTFIDPRYRDRIRLDSVTCVVDAEQVFAYEKEFPPLMDLKLRQIGFADMVVLNKVDLAGAEQTRRARAWIDDTFRRVRVVEARHCDVPLEILLAVGRFDPARLHRWEGVPAGRRPHEAHVSFATWSYASSRPFSMSALRTMVKKRLPGTIYRCKGIVYIAEAPERRAVLQIVGRRADVALMDAWADRSPRTQVVAIGAPGRIDAQALKTEFDGCLSPERCAHDASPRGVDTPA